MSSVPRSLAATILLLTLEPIAPCFDGDKLYTVSTLDPLIREVDPVTLLTRSSVAMTAPGVTINWANGLALHPLTDELFVLVTIQGSSARRLGKVNPLTGAVTILGNTGTQFASICFDTVGTLYAVTGDGATPPETLYTMNTSTGQPTFLMTLGNGNDGESIIHDPATGLLLHASGLGTRIFESINLSTLTVTNIPLTGDPPSEEVLCMAWLAGRNILVVDRGDNLSVITAGGLVNYVGILDHSSVKGAVFVPTRNAGYFRTYGDGCSATSGVIPAMWGSGSPTSNGAGALRIFNSAGAFPAVVTLGFANVRVQITPTCALQNWPIFTSVVFPLALQNSALGDFAATLPLQFPAGLPPMDLYFQAVVIEVPSLNVVVTNPVQAHVQ
jgi:hypothetical protein